MALGTPGRRLPIPEDLSSFLTELLGQPIAVSKSNEIELSSEEHQFVTGRYVDDKNRLLCACVADVALAATAGAALALIPRATADEAILAGELDENLSDNYHEVVNILSKFLNGPTVPHVRLTELVAGVPDDLGVLLKGTTRRRDYDVTVVGYPGGHLTLLGT
jgi:hypothetical protein